MSNYISDHANYLAMSKPFDSAQEANEAIEKFHEELGELRKKYKIQNVFIVMNGLTTYENGSIGEYMIQLGFGDELKMEVLAAFGLGHTKATYRELVNTVLDSAREKKYTTSTMKK